MAPPPIAGVLLLSALRHLSIFLSALFRSDNELAIRVVFRLRAAGPRVGEAQRADGDPTRGIAKDRDDPATTRRS